jgi:hypothetical protein
MKLFALSGLALALLACSRPTPHPSPPPIPSSCCNVPAADAPGWIKQGAVVPPYDRLFLEQVEAEAGSRCSDPIDASLSLLASGLVSRNLCAAVWTASTLVVLRPDGLWEEWRPVDAQTGCWTDLDHAYVSAWRGPQMEGCTQ